MGHADGVTRRALAVNYANLALGHERLGVPHATVVRDPALPLIYDANFVTDVSAATDGEIDALLAAVDAALPHAPARVFRLLPDTPPAFEARLALAGYARVDSLVLLLEGALGGAAPAACDLRPVRSDEDWRAYAALKRADFLEHGAELEPDVAEQVAAGLAAANRSKCPPVRYWLAWVDGAPRGFFNAWEGLAGVGQVEDLYVDPGYRHRGIATALIHRCVAEARARGAGPVVIVADPDDTPRLMYAALGFRPVAVTRMYRRAGDAG